MAGPIAPVIAVINASEDVVNLLRDVLGMEGFRTAVGYVIDYRSERKDLAAFFAEHDPAVIVWDIAIPYEENWSFFNQVRAEPENRNRRFVLTTTNKRALEDLVGPTPAFEIVGKPFDLDQFVNAVRRALE